jgi:ribonucleoside-diphosphate reductase alpha chain
MSELITYLNDKNYPEYYDSNYKIADEYMNTIYHQVKPNKYELSKDPKLETVGAYSTFEGSPLSEGKFQFDLWNKTPLYKEKWNLLREKVIKYGTRNSLLTALMPTASTSQILGNNECFEFFSNNIYTRKTQAGDFVLVNKYLVNDLININVWSPELKDKIIAANGSIQMLDEIPQNLKEIYKTMWEIKQIWVLKGAAARGPFVDQTQSMNIFMAEPDYQRLTSSHFWGWKNGLKTGMYYLRSKPSTDAIKFTIDPKLIKSMKIETSEGCENCSA